VTREDQAKHQQRSFVAIDEAAMEDYSIEALIDNSTTDFDLYLRVGGTLSLYAKAPYKWLKDEMGRLLQDGHRHLFYSIADRPKVEAYKLVHALAKVDETAPPSTRVVQITDVAAELTRILYKHPLTDGALAQVGGIANSLVRCVEEDRTCVAALGKLANHDEYTYYHSARVAAYALAIALELSQHDKNGLTELATGALLHDVGKSKIDLSVLNKRGAFTQPEWDLMKQHPVFGGDLVTPSLLAHVPREIILHHHERFDGTGYPHNLAERELLSEVKIVAFADVFDALTTNRPYQVSRSRYEALDFIRHKLLKTMHKDSYEALVAILAREAQGEAQGKDGAPAAPNDAKGKGSSF
jgi:HD-GYP domain-containing protein (c-di-GMP phosphodiesterase class II)